MREGELSREVIVPPLDGDKESFLPLRGGRIHRAEGDAIGTSWRVDVVSGGAETGERVEDITRQVIASVASQMSQWEPQSELSRYNRAAAGTGLAISPGFATVLDCALNIARASEGAFDPTLGDVTERWGFGSSDFAASAVPDARSGADRPWQSIAFDRAARRVVQPGGVVLDLSGIAKGFAVDLVSIALARRGMPHHLVEIGGELRACGVKPDGQPWWVDIEQAPEADGSGARVALSGWSLATSGDWHRRRSAGGIDWSHSFSPATGRPVENGPRAATVLHRDCMQADALATVLMVLGVEKGVAFADRHGIPARVVGHDLRVHNSAAWRAFR